MYIGDNECVSQQQMADMQGRVDTLQSQLNYWQNVTINLLKELYVSFNSGMMHTLTQRSRLLWSF